MCASVIKSKPERNAEREREREREREKERERERERQTGIEKERAKEREIKMTHFMAEKKGDLIACELTVKVQIVPQRKGRVEMCVRWNYTH